MVGDAQAEEPVVEGARSQELQGFEKRAQGCQPSQGETSNMKLIIYIDLGSFFFEHICSFVFVNMTCYKWSQFAAGGQRGWSFPGLDDRDGSLCCDGCSRVFLGFKKGKMVGCLPDFLYKLPLEVEEGEDPLGVPVLGAELDKLLLEGAGGQTQGGI